MTQIGWPFGITPSSAEKILGGTRTRPIPFEERCSYCIKDSSPPALWHLGSMDCFYGSSYTLISCHPSIRNADGTRTRTSQVSTPGVLPLHHLRFIRHPTYRASGPPAYQISFRPLWIHMVSIILKIMHVASRILGRTRTCDSPPYGERDYPFTTRIFCQYPIISLLESGLPQAQGLRSQWNLSFR